MSRSKKRHLEWTFFLDENGRRQYNKLCKGCVHPCKQSFGMMAIVLPTLSFSLFSKVRELRLKTGEGTDQDGFFRDFFMILYMNLPLRYEGKVIFEYLTIIEKERLLRFGSRVTPYFFFAIISHSITIEPEEYSRWLILRECV